MDEKQRTSDLPHSYASISGRSQSCGQKVRAGFLSGAVFGASMSGLSAVAQASQLRIRFPDAVRAVVGSSLAGGAAFGGALGIYRGVVCSLEHMRGVQDIKNSMIAGGIVGVLSELPVLFRSMVITRSDMMAMEQGLPLIRPRPRFLTNAAAGSIICGVVYLVESAMRPSSGSLPQGSSSSRQPPVDANTLDNHDGQDNSGTDVDTWSSTDRLDSSSEWILRDSPDIDVTESKELDWGTE
ncbi:unnamed protein product [Sphagnum balticum]